MLVGQFIGTINVHKKGTKHNVQIYTGMCVSPGCWAQASPGVTLGCGPPNFSVVLPLAAGYMSVVPRWGCWEAWPLGNWVDGDWLLVPLPAND